MFSFEGGKEREAPGGKWEFSTILAKVSYKGRKL